MIFRSPIRNLKSAINLAQSKTHRLEIRQHLPQSRDVGGINDSGLPQAAFALAILFGQDVTFVCLCANELSRSGSLKAFRRCSVGFHFGHCILHKIGHEGLISLQDSAPCSRPAFVRKTYNASRDHPRNSFAGKALAPCHPRPRQTSRDCSTANLKSGNVLTSRGCVKFFFLMRFYLGAKIMTMLRPSILGDCSTTESSLSSSLIRSKTFIPSSV